MKIHREGTASILISVFIFISINLFAYRELANRFPYIWWLTAVLTTPLLTLVISFFRIPAREITIDDSLVIAPCDGKIVVI